MIRVLPLALASLIAAPALAGERVFDFSDFTGVSAGSGLTVEIAEGEGFSVVGEGSHRALDRLDIHKRGDMLVIEQVPRGLDRFSPLMWALADEAQVRVTLPDLQAVNASAGSEVTSSGSAAGGFSAEASSGSSLVVSGVDAGTVRLSSSSGARLTVEGRCGALEADASSGAGLNAGDLVCDTASAEASSGATVEITAAEVRAEASSGADVEVWGASTVEADESSGGDVRVHD